MAPRRRTRGGTIRVTQHTVQMADFRPGGWLQGGLILLGPVGYDVVDSELPYDVTLIVWTHDGRLAAQDIKVTQRSGGPPVTTDGLRSVTVDAYLDAVRAHLLSVGKLLLMAPVEGLPGAFEPPRSDQEAHFDRAQRPRRPMDETLPKVAAVYREALRSSDAMVAMAPTEEVGRRLGYSRGHASRLVTAARKEGLLDSARPGRAGEAKTAAKKRAAKTTKTTSKARRTK
jgi:hypothetical protein